MVVMFSLIGLLIAYYFMFWALTKCKRLRRLKKPYRRAWFALWCYWTLFLFWIFSQTFYIEEYADRAGYRYGSVGAYRYFIMEMLGHVILSFIVSGLFLLAVYAAVYMYQHYVEQRE